MFAAAPVHLMPQLLMGSSEPCQQVTPPTAVLLRLRQDGCR